MPSPDIDRLEAPIWAPTIEGCTAFASLVRWLRYVLGTTIADMEEEMGLFHTQLSKAFVRSSLGSDLPPTFCAWLLKRTGHEMVPDLVEHLASRSGDEWVATAKLIRAKLRRRSK